MQCMQKCKFFLQIHKQIIPQFIFPSHLPNWLSSKGFPQNINFLFHYLTPCFPKH
jgi:hypothetical protein